jgi:hydroxymethylbilane synthase
VSAPDPEIVPEPEPRTFIVGTRGSRLALRQTERVIDALRTANPGVRFQVRTIRTEGDRSAAPLSGFPRRGIFSAEIEGALLGGGIDIAVHSLKDLPNDETAGLIVAATPRRADPRDALITRDGVVLADLPPGATVGTGSPRRAAQVLALRPDLRVADIRGNVDTRMRKVEAGEYDAIVIAAAGLARLGWLERATQLFSPTEMLPAAGQGALAVQVRSDDREAINLARTIDDLETNVCVFAERTFEERLGGGCHAAIAALGVIEGITLRLSGLAADPRGERVYRGQVEGVTTDAEGLGLALAEKLIGYGAREVLVESPQ